MVGKHPFKVINKDTRKSSCVMVFIITLEMYFARIFYWKQIPIKENYVQS